MKAVLITTQGLAAASEKYLTDARSLLGKSIAAHRNTAEFRDLFKTCLAAEAVLQGLDSSALSPGLAPLRTIVLRIPLLAAAGQSSIVKVELRRYIEITFWVVYFSHHPIEWLHFSGKRGSGFSKDARKPIAFAASRDLNAFVEYAREYMEPEPSGIAARAISLLEQDKKVLNAAVHAGEIARAPSLNLPVDKPSPTESRKLAAMIKRIIGHSVLLLGGFNKNAFNGLAAGPRAYFDWVIPSAFRKDIRKGTFGMST